jgi:hypothetical protein
VADGAFNFLRVSDPQAVANASDRASGAEAYPFCRGKGEYRTTLSPTLSMMEPPPPKHASGAYQINNIIFVVFTLSLDGGFSLIILHCHNLAVAFA